MGPFEPKKGLPTGFPVFEWTPAGRFGFWFDCGSNDAIAPLLRYLELAQVMRMVWYDPIELILSVPKY